MEHPSAKQWITADKYDNSGRNFKQLSAAQTREAEVPFPTARVDSDE